jgi:cbb3-type cytochrome oxidase subunit 3
MRLSDVMGYARLELFAEIGLVIFGLIFLGVLVYTFSKRNRRQFEAARRMPLDHDQIEGSNDE